MEAVLLIFALFVSLQRKHRRRLENIRKINSLNGKRRYKRFWKTRNAFITLTLSRSQTSLQPEYKRMWSKNRSRDWWDNIVPTFTEVEWLQHFRMRSTTFKFLSENLGESLLRKDTTFRKSVPVDVKLGSCLWKLATNADYRSIGHLFGIARSTACQAFHEVVDSINTVLTPVFIRCPSTERFREIIDEFHNKWGFPNTIGAIDGTHLPILAPKEIPADYHNRKGFYSIILQAVVDASYKFWNINVG